LRYVTEMGLTNLFHA